MPPLIPSFGSIIRKWDILSEPVANNKFYLYSSRNVDRLFAICPASEETVTTQVGTQETNTTLLTPFWADPNVFWTSDGVRKNGNFGYVYPETQAWKFSTAQQYQANVSAVLRQLYGGSSLASIIADSTPGNLSNRAQLNIPVRASVRLATRESAKPTEASLAIAKASSAIVAAADTVLDQQFKANEQKPLGVANPKHDKHKVNTKHEQTRIAAPKHEGTPQELSRKMKYPRPTPSTKTFRRLSLSKKRRVRLCRSTMIGTTPAHSIIQIPNVYTTPSFRRS